MKTFIRLMLFCCLLGLFQVASSSSYVVTSKTDQLQVKNGTEYCYLCLVLMEKLDFLIQQNSSLEILNTTLYKLCSYANGTLREECFKSIPLVLQELESGFNPEVACMKLKLCLETRSSIKAGNRMRDQGYQSAGKRHKRSESNINPNVKCTLCKNLVKLIDKDLYKDEVTLKTNVDKLCHYFPSPTDVTCTSTMDYQIPIWWEDFFQRIVTPDDICHFLKLCP